MPIYNDIQNHMKNKFSSTEKVISLDNTPNEERIKNLKDNILYKAPLIAISVDVVDFKKLNTSSDPEALSKVMSEFVYGVTKIMKEYDCIEIDIQGDGIIALMPSANNKKNIDSAFTLACMLNSFQNHLKKNINKYFSSEIKKTSSYSWSETTGGDAFTFGIGLYLSWDNYISKVGHGATREVIFMGDSINHANLLSKKAARNNWAPIAMGDVFYSNFTDEKKEKVFRIGGFSSYIVSELNNERCHFCNWIISGYESFIVNNT